EGSDLTVTVDAGAQRLATSLLNAQGPGALVALEPKTGAVRAMVSTPGYDPNEIPARLDEFNNLPDGADSVLLNRTTQGRYAPGSTMKVVTAAAALDSGDFEPDSVVDGTDGVEISGVPLQNSGNFSQSQITLTDALTNSVNTAWAQVAEDLGEDTMVEYMERFGFFKLPPLDYPDQQMTASGPRKTNGRLTRSGFDVGRVAIGQGGAEGQMQATPIQIAMIAATVANGGKLMEPTFLQDVTDPDGRVTDELDPDEVRQVIAPETAAELTEMMTNVTQEGTASNLNITGTDVFAGKTGTAERDLQGLNQAWFMMFAPADDPQIAIAATVESCQGCFGGTVAGPIATAVAEELLGG
ncbi:MAG TPA: penicillin-binding protein 2, partial [Solirubrobacterales bacterium]|nr:penicillin-binding protein 2 [Solirubrobacterales bacterium]